MAEVTEDWGRVGLPILVTYDDVTLDLIEIDAVNNLGRPVLIRIKRRSGPNFWEATLADGETFNRTNFQGPIKRLDQLNGYSITPV